MQVAIAGDTPHPDKMIGSKQVTGRLLSYQEGDYAHASLRSEAGGERSFFVDDEICFLALNRKEVLTIEYDEIERFFPEGSGYFPANIIRSIATSVKDKRWIRGINSKPSVAELAECARILRTALDGAL